MKQNLPSFMHDSDVGWAYYDFRAEWGQFLQHGITTQFNGEIDRCFWGALDDRNVLRNNRTIERYRSYRLGCEGGESIAQGPCAYETVSESGDKISVWRTCRDL